jgi:hypothetical protein
MHLEADLSRDAGALDQLAEASECERCILLRNEKRRATWPRGSQRSQFIPEQWMRAPIRIIVLFLAP